MRISFEFHKKGFCLHNKSVTRGWIFGMPKISTLCQTLNEVCVCVCAWKLPLEIETETETEIEKSNAERGGERKKEHINAPER